jgi:hypothetical protein
MEGGTAIRRERQQTTHSGQKHPNLGDGQEAAKRTFIDILTEEFAVPVVVSKDPRGNG